MGGGAGAGYVQDERYAAGAGMRRSGLFQIGTVSGVLRPLGKLRPGTDRETGPGHGIMNVLVAVQN